MLKRKKKSIAHTRENKQNKITCQVCCTLIINLYVFDEASLSSSCLFFGLLIIPLSLHQKCVFPQKL